MRNLILPIAILSLVSVPCFADDNNAALEKSCKISRKQAQEIALKKIAGVISDTELEKSDKDGILYWSIDVKPSAEVKKEVHVDAQSGTVLKVEDDKD